ncbi:MAG: NUDIX domain-containing protein [Campylobacteraceae bacterium]|nr:NUDIX domain-containing protein [Campylobacteraceae bacterium]
MSNDHKKAYGLCIYKIKKNNIKILLCKSVKSRESWGFLKGVVLKNEDSNVCAQREVEEESSIFVEKKYYEEYFEQLNKEKDIGIWLVNAKNILGLNEKFEENKLHNIHLSWENQKVKFFELEYVPKIREKQKYLFNDIKDFLQSKS